MALEMKVPSPGESITEVEIAEWLVEDGDYVEKDQAIAEVDSDKATLELPAEASGIITLKAEEGDEVAVGAVVCLIDTDAEKPADDSDKEEKSEEKKEESEEKKEGKEPEPKKEEKEEKTYASGTPSPAAKKELDEKGIKPSAVSGTGKAGRITKEDAVKAKPSMGTPGPGKRGEKRERMSMMRRKTAERLVESQNTAAMLTTFNEVDMSAIFNLRNKYKEDFKTKHGVNLGFMSFFSLACVRALDIYPSVGAMIDGREMITFDFVDISIAVSGPRGLMVPVIRNTENLGFRGVESEVKRLATKARDGKLSIDEMTGGNFTITNGGVFGSMLSTPIINPPQSAILGMHNIVERPVAIDGKVEIRPIMYVALSYDHRIIDGKESVSFLVEVKKALENPEELLMDGDIKSALEL
ncbi:MAG TPA: 2-oxoglutarate dehydrogenase complex dihydrolipoyllysine-residue succinyltransferase [Flavobacteriaceae bacterium]|nr:2-oxoglutarate dehydrogenase complex dihydrolipoyllysine-residue succinyltransferase [Flavobacteriaceae bacterium]